MKCAEDDEGECEIQKEDSAGIREFAKRVAAAKEESPPGDKQRADSDGLEDLYYFAGIRERALILVDALIDQHRKPHRNGEVQDSGVRNKFRRPCPSGRRKDGGFLAKLESGKETERRDRRVKSDDSRLNDRHYPWRHSVFRPEGRGLCGDRGFGSHSSLTL